MLNKIILIGRLTRDPELRYTPNGVAVATFSIAVERPFQNSQGEREADFIKIVAWRKLGEICASNLGKGRLVAVEGRLQVSVYEAEGVTRQVAEVVAENIRFLDWPKDQAQTQGQQKGKSQTQGKTNDFPQPADPFMDESYFDFPDDLPF